MVSSLEQEKDLKNKNDNKGSEDEPLHWETPMGTPYWTYKKDGKWYASLDEGGNIGEFHELKDSEYNGLLDKEFESVESGMEESGDDLELTKKAKTPAEVKGILHDDETKKKVLADYKLGKSTGAIAKGLGLPQDKPTRNLIRNILKKAGIYKQKDLKFAGPDKKDIQHKEVKGVSAMVALFKKIGEAMGSNPGGLYEGSDGVKRYVKFYKEKAQASCEMLSNSIYNDLGLNAPTSTLFDDNGKAAFASDYIDGAKTLKSSGLTPDLAKKVMKGFAADVLLKNWDAIGTGMDNIVVKGDQVYRIDNGGSLLYRAKAGKKQDSSLKDMSELTGFFDSSKNPYYAQVAKAAGYRDINSMGSELTAQISDIESLVNQSGGWEAYLDKVNPQLDVTSKQKVAEMLKTRTEALKGVAKSLGQKPTKAAAGAEQTTLHSPTTFEPGKLTAWAKKYADQLGPSPSPYGSGTAEAIFHNYLKEAGIKNGGEAVKTAINGWTGTSHGKGAALLKIVAAEFYGKDYTGEPKLDKTVANYGSFEVAKQKADAIKEAFIAHKELTKEWVSKYGAKTVYRGLRGDIAKKIKEAIQKGDKEIEFSANTLSSWSESKNKAESFGHGGVMLKMKVNPDHVWSCYKAAPYGFGSFMAEKEYIMGVPGETFKIPIADVVSL
jgi:hypothetical protein